MLQQKAAFWIINNTKFRRYKFWLLPVWRPGDLALYPLGLPHMCPGEVGHDSNYAVCKQIWKWSASDAPPIMEYKFQLIIFDHIDSFWRRAPYQNDPLEGNNAWSHTEASPLRTQKEIIYSDTNRISITIRRNLRVGYLYSLEYNADSNILALRNLKDLLGRSLERKGGIRK